MLLDDVLREAFAQTLLPIFDQPTLFAMAALEQGDLMLPAALAVAGSVAALSVWYVLGVMLLRKYQAGKIDVSEQHYSKSQQVMQRAAFVLLLAAGWTAGGGIVALACGFFRVAYWQVVVFGAGSLTAYYAIVLS